MGTSTTNKQHLNYTAQVLDHYVYHQKKRKRPTSYSWLSCQRDIQKPTQDQIEMLVHIRVDSVKNPSPGICRGVCCDDCSIQHHKSCIAHLHFESMNQKHQMHTNIYRISTNHQTICSMFSPIKTSSPNTNQHARNFSVKSSECSRSAGSSNPYDIPPKKNIRIMTVNCRSIKDKKP